MQFTLRHTHVLNSYDIHVWWVSTEYLAGDGEDLEWVLSARERLRRTRLAPREDRRDYAAAHALLRTTLSMYGSLAPEAWLFEESTFGKPHLVHRAGTPPLEFNLSHAPGLVACAVSGGPKVGIDVECIDRVTAHADIQGRCLSQAERARLSGEIVRVRASRFAELWTLKEALLKMVGIGLRWNPATISFDLGTDGAIRFEPPDGFPPAPFQFALYQPTAHHRMAVVAECSGARPPRICARAANDGREIAPTRTTSSCVVTSPLP